MVFDIVFLLILIFLSAFFSSSETALMSISKVKMRSILEEGRAGSKTLARVKAKPHRLLITILIGNCLVTVAAASVATVIAVDIFGNSGVGIATGVITILLLIFGEISPKSFAVQNAEKLSLWIARPIEFLEKLFLPATIFFEVITKFINSFSKEVPKELTEEELRTIIVMGREEGILDKEETERLHAVLDFERATVKQIMTPNAQVITFAAGTTVKEFLDSVLDAPYDRYPLYEGNPENIVGIVDVIDVLREVKSDNFKKTLKDIKKETFFVKEDTRLDAIVPAFREKATSMGIVTDNQNRMVGVFTSQDIVEEIVGDIFEKEIYKTRFKANG